MFNRTVEWCLLIKDITMLGYSIVPRNNQNYRLVGEGDRWQCIRCGSCCNADFEENWLDFIASNQNPKSLNGKCSNLEFDNNPYACSIHSTRPNACKAFPFTLKRQDDGSYKLVLHTKCKGYGKGKIINIRKMIIKCLRYSNVEFHKNMRFDFTSFDTNRSVMLVK